MAGTFNKNKKSSLLDNLQSNIQDVDVNEIKIVPSLNDTIDNNFIEEKIIENNDRVKSVDLNDLLNDIKNDTEHITEENINSVDELINDSNNILNVDDVNGTPIETLDILEAVVEAVEEIPDITIDSIDNIEITKTKKSGWIKNKVNVNSLTFSKEISNLASICKKESGGVVRIRKCDVRLIANTNKTQLRGSDLKLLSESYTIKPVGGVVAKSTRVMLSMNPDDKESIIVYFQISRKKFIHKFEIVDGNEFVWLADWILRFYDSLNFDLSKHRLLNRSYGESELFGVIKTIAKTKKFNIKLPKILGNDIDRFSFNLIHGDKSHLRFHVTKNIKLSYGKPLNIYGIICTSDIDKNLYLKVSNVESQFNFTESQLISNKFLISVENVIENFDNSKFSVDDLAFNKLKHTALKKALISLINFEDEENKIGLEILRVMSSADVRKALTEQGDSPMKNYNAENFVIKTKYIDFAIIQYQAILEVGGDKRHGREYITRQEYYEKYNVKDRNKYQQRKNTALIRHGEDRNYNSRKYKFKMYYTIDGVKQKPLITKSFDEILNKSGILTTKPV